MTNGPDTTTSKTTPGDTRRERPSPEEVARLYRDGWSLSQIGNRFGYTPGAVRKWLIAARVDRRPAADGQRQAPPPVHDPEAAAVVVELRRLYVDVQLSLGEIGQRFGHSADWARIRLVRAGVTIRTTTFTLAKVSPALIEEMTRLYVDAGRTTKEIAEHVGRTRQWVSTHLEAAGVQLKPGGARRLVVDEAHIVEQYLRRRRSMNAIATDLNIGPTVVRRVLEAHDIAIRDRGASLTIIDVDELRRLYLDEELPTGEIATRLGMSSSGVGAALHRYNIPIRQRGVALTISRDELQQHLDDGLTNTEIAAQHDVATQAVTLRLRTEQMRRHPKTPTWTKPTPPKLTLRDLYVDQELSLADIAVRYGVPHATVRRWLHKNGIERRPHAYTPNPQPGHDLDHETIRALYIDEEWTAAEIGRHIGVTKKIILDHLHQHGVALRPSGAKRPATDRALLDRLYADPNVCRLLRDHQIPLISTPGRLRRRFPNPAPLTALLVTGLYNNIGLSVSQISLVTGHFDPAVRTALQQAGVAARDGAGRAPWTVRNSESASAGVERSPSAT